MAGRFVVRRGDWILGAWSAVGDALLVRLLMVRRPVGWRGLLLRVRQEGRTRQPLSAPPELDVETVTVICDELVAAHLDDGRCTCSVRVDVRTADLTVARRRLSLLPGLAI